MLKNAPSLDIVAVHTDENEPSRVSVRNNKITYSYSLFETQILYLPGFSQILAAIRDKTRRAFNAMSAAGKDNATMAVSSWTFHM